MLNGNAKKSGKKEDEKPAEKSEEDNATEAAPVPVLADVEKDLQVKSALDILKSWEIFKKRQDRQAG